MDELKQIKQKIYEEDLVGDLLERLECENVRPSNNSYIAELPVSFNSDSIGSVQVYVDDDFLKSFVWSRQVEGDIYTLVSYLMTGDKNPDVLNRHLPKAIEKVKKLLGLSVEDGGWIEEDPNAWLKEIQKRKKKRVLLSEKVNEILPNNVMDQFIMYPHVKWLSDGIDYNTMVEFEVGVDVPTERIVFPIHNYKGEYVGIKGRRTNPHDEAKYLSIYPFHKSYELFNLHRALPYIKKKNQVIVFESEKSCMKSHMYNAKNSVALMGSDISRVQAELIKRHCGEDVQIVICLDKDKGVGDYRHVKRKLDVFDDVWAIYDTRNYLQDKESPVDVDRETFINLYKHCKYKIN